MSSYPGMAQAVTDLVAGQLQFIVPVIPTVAGQLRGGTLKPLAVGSPAREQGIDFVHHTWFGLLAPRGTPAEMLAGMQAALAAATRGGDYTHFLEEAGATVPDAASATFRAVMAAETALWSRMLREHKIRVE
jgi:tripartite-type tricarboxylate transporter receptor subunit TctC